MVSNLCWEQPSSSMSSLSVGSLPSLDVSVLYALLYLRKQARWKDVIPATCKHPSMRRGYM